MKEMEIENLQNEHILRFIAEHDVNISGVFLWYSNKHEYRQAVARYAVFPEADRH
jgi:ActR/RegA family two-component response regulator